MPYYIHGKRAKILFMGNLNMIAKQLITAGILRHEVCRYGNNILLLQVLEDKHGQDMIPNMTLTRAQAGVLSTLWKYT